MYVCMCMYIQPTDWLASHSIKAAKQPEQNNSMFNQLGQVERNASKAMLIPPHTLQTVYAG